MVDVIGRAIIKVVGELDPSSTSKIGKGFKAALVPALGALAGLAVGAKSAIDAASDLNESASKSAVIFGSASKSIDQFASNASKTIGQSKRAALDAASTFGGIAQGAGLGEKASAQFAKQFTTLASDLASFNNTSPEEAMVALGAAMRGESEPIRKYNVLLDDATLKARALKEGIIDQIDGSLTPQQKALAASAEILAQTGKAQGDYARTQQGAANQSRDLAAQSEDLKAKLGTDLLPIYIKAQKTALDFLNVMKENPGATKAAIGAIAGLSAGVVAVNGAMKVFSAGSAVATGAGKVVSAAGRMRDGFRDANAAQSAFSGKAGTIGGKIKTASSALASGAKAAASWAAAMGRAAASAAASAGRAAIAWVVAGAKIAASAVASAARATAAFVAAAARQIAAWALMGAQALINAAKIALAWVIALGPVGLLIAAIALVGAAFAIAWKKSETFRNIVKGALNAVKAAAIAVWNAIKTAASTAWAFISGYIKLQILIVTTVIKALKTAAVAVWNAIKSTATTVWNGIKTVITTVIRGIVTAANGIKTAFQNVWNGVKTAGLAAFDVLKGAINAVIRSINTAIDLIQSVPGVPNVIGNIPELATGVRNFGGGLAVVGEQGPELVNLPRGADVHTNRESRHMASRGVGKTINNFNLYGPNSLSEARRSAQWAEDFGSRFGGVGAAAV